jgi:nitrite reductase/ring-hydroxylating ferredoxin subunit
VADDDVQPHDIRGRKLRLSVARLDGFEGLCAHEQCPLSAGLLKGVTIMCQCHGSKYDLSTGAVLRGPADDSLAIYEVREHQGELQVKV